MFSSRLPLSSLIELCRVLRHYLGAGLTLRDVFRQQTAAATRISVPWPGASPRSWTKAAPSKTP